MLKNMEEQSRQKDERISRLRDCLTIAEKELDECRRRVEELEAENYINEQTIRKLQDQSEDGSHKSSRSRTISSTVSSSSLIYERDTYC